MQVIIRQPPSQSHWS